ncbi:hypothetical protein DL770_001714 [Monosporascus sp. CRB-9-2]|nr:hypothetical protein DL770_001714 [Monosporascus sp. CRB-9-2]
MAEDGILEAFQALHRDLTAVVEALKSDREDLGRRLLAGLPQNPTLEAVGERFKRLLEKDGRKKESRDRVLSGKISISDVEWNLNREFQEIALQVADDLDLDEVEAAKLVLDSEDNETEYGRPRRECAVIRFLQQRVYLLDCMRLLLELAKDEDELLADGEDDYLGLLGQFVDQSILRRSQPGHADPVAKDRFIPACMATMGEIRAWLQKLIDQKTSATVLGRSDDLQFQETADYTHGSLVRQHELLAVILCSAIEKHVATKDDFVNFVRALKTVDKYDFSTVHLFPVLGTYITMFGSTEGTGSVEEARQLNEIICRQADDDTRQLPYLNAAIRAWWIAEYSGWYMEGAAGDGLPGVDLDAEDQERSKQFFETLRDGAFDFMFAIVADLKTSEWQDPARVDMRRWLQSRTPALPQEAAQFSDFLQARLAAKLETFVDAFISNMPDVLRKLRIEEDEQRQMRQAQQQELDLERFLLIIAYSYEGRPEAADAFWSDPESNLAGFLHWASRRASTPLVTAFCEMLQCLSEDPESAKSAHNFLLDEAHHASGKMRRSLSLTWAQIFKEVEYFANKIRENPGATQGNAAKIGKFTNETAEAEPESTMMLECYLRLMAKLASQSEEARKYLLDSNVGLVELLYQLISSLVTPRLRACAFKALGALMSRKNLAEAHIMWRYLESCLTGYYIPPSSNRTLSTSPHPPPPSYYMEALFQSMSPYFDETSAFIQFLTVLTSLPETDSTLHDDLPYPEDLGASTRMRPGIEPYIDFSLGHVFALRTSEAQDANHQRILRYYCLDFAVTAISSFNEDLLILNNETNINVDSAISTRDLATYVTLHPFARAMEWMYDSKFIRSLLDTIHQNSSDIGKASPDSPLILSILRAVELVSKVLDLQATYLDLVRPILKSQPRTPSRSPYIPTSNGAFASVEDGLLTSMSLVSDLGNFCGLGNEVLTLASLKLLEKIATSPRIISAWDLGTQTQPRRNKAIVALEEFGQAETIAASLAAELKKTLDVHRQADDPSYLVKIYILDFIYSCLSANPDRPTIAHLLLGFQCGINTLSIVPGSAFDKRSSLFHMLLPLMIDIPSTIDGGLFSPWLINLRYKAMRILKILWCSKLSSGIVLDELREHEFTFHLLVQGLVVERNGAWDKEVAMGSDFLTQPAAQGYIDQLSMRAMAMEYIAHELCSVSRGNMPALKRRIFDALGGQMRFDGGNAISIPSVFEFNDTLPQENGFESPPPELNVFRDLDIRACLESDDASNPVYNIEKVREVLLLKRNETRTSGQVVLHQEPDPLDAEQQIVLGYVVYLNRIAQVRAHNLRLLRAWTKLLLVMSDLNDFKGTSQVSFILQTLQAILPSLEVYGSEKPEAAYELAKLVKILLFKLDFSIMASTDKQSRAIESLVSDKLFQLLHISLGAIAKWVGNPTLRSVYYSICYRYLTALVDHAQGISSDRRKTARTVQAFGDKLINVICDDAFCGDAGCQAAALILLGTLVHLGNQQGDNYVVESLNRLNFIGVLVDSLRNVLREWVEITRTGNPEQEHDHNAKLALLLQLCQTRDGAKNVLHANLFRAIDQSGLFSADPELQADSASSRALEKHYTLLVKVTRIIGAAIVSRGSHNMLQGRRFLTEHRMLVMHVLKRSAGIGSGGAKMDKGLLDRINELAEAFMVIITATGFLEFENETLTEDKRPTPILFH